jgi:hypothetical protein
MGKLYLLRLWEGGHSMHLQTGVSFAPPFSRGLTKRQTQMLAMVGASQLTK